MLRTSLWTTAACMDKFGTGLGEIFKSDGFIIAMSNFARFFVWCNSLFMFTSIWKMHDHGMQWHAPCLPACRSILKIHRGLDTVKIFGKQDRILFAQNLSDVIGKVTKNLRQKERCVP